MCKVKNNDPSIVALAFDDSIESIQRSVEASIGAAVEG